MANDWPEGVVRRYLTLAAATVDMVALEDALGGFEVVCRGCQETTVMGGEWDARSWAHGHAERCRELPKPEVS